MVNDNEYFFNVTEEKDIVERYKEPLYYSYRCPVCGSRHIVRNGTYIRKALYFDGKTVQCKAITIQKFLCRDCNHSFHDVPVFLSPCSRFCIGMIISILFFDGSVRSTAKKFDVSRSVVRRFKFVWRHEKRKIESLKIEAWSYKNIIEQYKHKFGYPPFSTSTNLATV